MWGKKAYYFIFPQYSKPRNSQFYENVGNKQHDSIGIDTENLAESAILKLSRLSFMLTSTKFLSGTELLYFVMLTPPTQP